MFVLCKSAIKHGVLAEAHTIVRTHTATTDESWGLAQQCGHALWASKQNVHYRRANSHVVLVRSRVRLARFSMHALGEYHAER
jgi:hypothetical protein